MAAFGYRSVDIKRRVRDQVAILPGSWIEKRESDRATVPICDSLRMPAVNLPLDLGVMIEQFNEVPASPVYGKNAVAIAVGDAGAIR